METQVIDVNGRTSINVVLKEAAEVLEEVVVVGYGTQRVKDLTGAAAPIPVDEVTNLPGASNTDALAGQVVGLHVSTSSGRPGAKDLSGFGNRLRL